LTGAAIILVAFGSIRSGTRDATTTFGWIIATTTTVTRGWTGSVIGKNISWGTTGGGKRALAGSAIGRNIRYIITSASSHFIATCASTSGWILSGTIGQYGACAGTTIIRIRNLRERTSIVATTSTSSIIDHYFRSRTWWALTSTS
jgi:hypothetical protein